MSSSTTTSTIAISLETGCDYASCAEFAFPLYHQLSEGHYDRCSVQPLPQDLYEWEQAHRTARKRVWRSLARGYHVQRFKREEHADELHAINTSMPNRQGKPMASSYLTHQEYGPLPDYPCERHAIRTWGVFTPDDVLVGYLNMYRCGDLCLVSQILGHGDHLKREIMWPLFAIAMLWEIDQGPGVVVYNRHDSGTSGLRWFKERLGFTEQQVEWLP